MDFPRIKDINAINAMQSFGSMDVLGNKNHFLTNNQNNGSVKRSASSTKPLSRSAFRL